MKNSPLKLSEYHSHQTHSMTPILTVFVRYRVIVLDLLYQMLRETHGIEARCLSLTSSSGRCLRILTNAILNLLPTVRKQVRVCVTQSCIISQRVDG